MVLGDEDDDMEVTNPESMVEDVSNVEDDVVVDDKGITTDVVDGVMVTIGVVEVAVAVVNAWDVVRIVVRVVDVRVVDGLALVVEALVVAALVVVALVVAFVVNALVVVFVGRGVVLVVVIRRVDVDLVVAALVVDVVRVSNDVVSITPPGPCGKPSGHELDPEEKDPSTGKYVHKPALLYVQVAKLPSAPVATNDDPSSSDGLQFTADARPMADDKIASRKRDF